MTIHEADPAESPATVHASVVRLYARQSHAIDEGDAAAWAATFTEDGVFRSPTFGRDVVGYDALVRFAEGVFQPLEAEGVRQRHWVNSVVVDQVGGATMARAYLMIVRIGQDGAPTLLRHVSITDELSLTPELGPKVRRRTVRRDP